MSCDSAMYIQRAGTHKFGKIWLKTSLYPKSSFVCNENLTFVSLILSLIFQSNVTAICLKFLLIFSQRENKKEIIY